VRTQKQVKQFKKDTDDIKKAKNRNGQVEVAKTTESLKKQSNKEA